MAERPTFSPFWHRVRVMRPRLRSHVQITRQFYRGRRWHVVHDPASNQFYRLNPIAHEFVGLLDGRRTVEEVWHLSLERHGDSAPTQNEVIQLLSQLYNSNLLSADATPEVEQLLRRGRERRKKKIQQQALGIMYFRTRLFNPDRYLQWIQPILRPILNRWGFLAWCAWLLAGIYSLLPHLEALRAGFDSAIAPSNWPWLIVVFVVTKAIHETGHGVICRRFGGQVPEFGVMLLVLFPAPYVDASSCWAFPNKWQRVAVGAGGMIFELAIATAAGFVWLSTAGGSLAHQLSYNALLTASVSTILFNANPLMRFDGYYILADLIEVPNLMQRSMNMLKYGFQRYVYRIKQAKPPTTIPAERAILITYGIGALAYRMFLFFSITLLVMGKLFAIGLILAMWTAAAWFLIPVGKFVHWLATDQQLSEFRTRAIFTSLGMIVSVVVLTGAVPMPDHRRGSGVIQSLHRTTVFFGSDGFVVRALHSPGDRVREGDPIVVSRSDELHARLEAVGAQIREYEAVERQSLATNPARAQIAREQIAVQRDLERTLLDRIDMLTVRAPHDGVIVGPDPRTLVGAFAKRGQALCEVVDTTDVRIAATMSQSEAAWLFDLSRDQYSVQVRLVSRPETAIDGGAVTPIDAGQVLLPHASLGFGGGGTIETDPRDTRGILAKTPQFIVYVRSGDGTPFGPPGQRVRLRFTLPSRPLLAQWIDRLQKLVQGKVTL